LTEEIRSLARRARALYDLGRYEDAVPLFRRVITSQPDDVWTWFQLSYSLRATSQLNEARRTAERTIAVDPTHECGYRVLALVLCDLGRPEEALGAIRRATGNRPTSYYPWLVRSDLARWVGRHGEALEATERLLELAPETPACLLQAVWNAPSWAESASTAARLLSLAPESAQGHNGLGWAQWKLGDDDAAESSFRRAISLSPGLPPALFNLALVNRWKGADVQAAQMAAEARERQLHQAEEVALSTDSPAYGRRLVARALWSSRRYDEALAEFRLAVRTDPGDAWTWHLMTWCAAASGRGRLAWYAATRGSHLLGDSPRALFNLALAGALVGRPDESRRAAERLAAHSVRPESASNARAYAAIAAEEWGDAEESLLEALRFDPRDCVSLSWLAVAQSRLGRKRQARESRRTALRLHPGCNCGGARIVYGAELEAL
jgi:tetratricopeptide (TPR) repeat protein